MSNQQASNPAEPGAGQDLGWAIDEVVRGISSGHLTVGDIDQALVARGRPVESVSGDTELVLDALCRSWA